MAVKVPAILSVLGRNSARKSNVHLYSDIIFMFYPTLHLLLHVAVPGLVAVTAFRPRWIQVWLVMVLTMLVDLDHLLADPIFDPARCSIGYHPLHTYLAIGFYTILIWFPRLRIIGLGLLIHMVLDGLDCIM